MVDDGEDRVLVVIGDLDIEPVDAGEGEDEHAQGQEEYFLHRLVHVDLAGVHVDRTAQLARVDLPVAVLVELGELGPHELREPLDQDAAAFPLGEELADVLQLGGVDRPVAVLVEHAQRGVEDPVAPLEVRVFLLEVRVLLLFGRQLLLEGLVLLLEVHIEAEVCGLRVLG